MYFLTYEDILMCAISGCLVHKGSSEIPSTDKSHNGKVAES